MEKKNHFGPYVPLWHQTAWENKIMQKSCDFWSAAIQLCSPAAFVHYTERDPDMLYVKLHNTLNSAKERGAWPHSSPASNLPRVGTVKGREEPGWAGQGSRHSVQSFSTIWVRHTGCHPSLNKGSGKTVIDLTGPEFLCLIIYLWCPPFPGMSAQLLLRHRPSSPPASPCHHPTQFSRQHLEIRQDIECFIFGAGLPGPCISCVWILGGVRSRMLWGAGHLSALSFLSWFIFFFNTVYWPCFYRKGNTVTFLLGAKPLEFLSSAAFLTMQPEGWEHTHGKTGRSAL